MSVTNSAAVAVPYRETLSRFGVLAEPIGYVDGQNLYEFVGSGPVDRVDPMGLEITYAGVNTEESQKANQRDPVEVGSEKFDEQFVKSHGYGGTFLVDGKGRVELVLKGEVRVKDLGCNVFEATATYVPTGRIGSTVNTVFIGQAKRAALKAENVDLGRVDAAITALNEKITRHEEARYDIWKSVYEASYELSEKGGSEDEAREKLEEKRVTLQRELHTKQYNLYNKTFADRMRKRDDDLRDELLAALKSTQAPPRK